MAASITKFDRTLGVVKLNVQGYRNVRLGFGLNVFEYDTVILEPADALNADQIDAADARRYQHNLLALSSWVHVGNTLVVVLTEFRLPLYAMANERGRFEAFNVLSAPMFQETRISPIAGNRVQYVGPDQFRGILAPFMRDLRYDYVLSHASQQTTIPHCRFECGRSRSPRRSALAIE